jgi:hypothetical protein
VTETGIREILDNNAIVGAPKLGARRFWSTTEESILRENYERFGVVGCIKLLPGRSASSIYNHVGIMGLRRAGRSSHNFRNQIWTSNPQIDALITRVVQGTPRRNMMKDLARTIGRPRWWVSKRAIQLGLTTPRFKEARWTEEELELAVTNAHRTPNTIRKMLLAKGFKRSETAILVKLKHEGYATGRNADDNHYTAHALASAFGVDGKTVTRWIAIGLLRARKRGTERVSAQGGDEWRIHRSDVRAFIIGNVNTVDFRKIDKFWLVDLLAHKEGV